MLNSVLLAGVVTFKSNLLTSPKYKKLRYIRVVVNTVLSENLKRNAIPVVFYNKKAEEVNKSVDVNNFVIFNGSLLSHQRNNGEVIWNQLSISGRDFKVLSNLGHIDQKGSVSTQDSHVNNQSNVPPTNSNSIKVSNQQLKQAVETITHNDSSNNLYEKNKKTKYNNSGQRNFDANTYSKEKQNSSVQVPEQKNNQNNEKNDLKRAVKTNFENSKIKNNTFNDNFANTQNSNKKLSNSNELNNNGSSSDSEFERVSRYNKDEVDLNNQRTKNNINVPPDFQKNQDKTGEVRDQKKGDPKNIVQNKSSKESEISKEMETDFEDEENDDKDSIFDFPDDE